MNNILPPPRERKELRFPRKFDGAQARLFAAGCVKYSENAEDDCNINPIEHPLFIRLSLNQRIKLISEVAVGLLCAGEPLPPETIEHYSAYLGVIACIRTELEIEMDDLNSNRHVGVDFLKQYYELRSDQTHRTNEEMAEWGIERALLKKIGRKHKRKLDKNQANDTSDEEVEFQVESKLDTEAAIEAAIEGAIEAHKKKIALIFDGGPCSDRIPSRRLTDIERSNGFYWRLLCDAAFLEDVTPGFATPPLSHVNFCWHSYREDKWYEAVNHLFFQLPSVSREEIAKKH